MNLDPFLPGLSPSLCETYPPSQSNSPTSISAAQSISHKAPTQAQRILDYLTQCGPRGATMLEIRDATGLQINSVCGRIGTLHKLALVKETGETRVNATGRPAIVWRAI